MKISNCGQSAGKIRINNYFKEVANINIYKLFVNKKYKMERLKRIREDIEMYGLLEALFFIPTTPFIDNVGRSIQFGFDAINDLPLYCRDLRSYLQRIYNSRKRI